MKKAPAPHTVLPFPRARQLMVDGGKLGLRKHMVHGLFEFDITDTRKAIRRHRAETGEPLSFQAFFLSALGKAIEADLQVHAYRSRFNKVIVFDEVDVNMLFELDIDGVKTIRPHIFRGVNKKNSREIQQEISSFQDHPESGGESKFIDWFVSLPGFVRRYLLRSLLRNPHRLKEMYGTVLVSSIGMFGKGSGWGIPVPNHSLQLTLGGIAEKPAVVNHKIEIRQFMSVTLSFDHDIIDGAPAARFIQRLKKLVECGTPE